MDANQYAYHILKKGEEEYLAVQWLGDLKAFEASILAYNYVCEKDLTMKINDVCSKDTSISLGFTFRDTDNETCEKRIIGESSIGYVPLGYWFIIVGERDVIVLPTEHVFKNYDELRSYELPKEVVNS